MVVEAMKVMNRNFVSRWKVTYARVAYRLVKAR